MSERMWAVTEFLVLTLTALGVFLAVSTATAWAARSRRYWLGTALIGAAVSPALLVFGYHMVLIFVIQAGIGAGFAALLIAGQARCRKECNRNDNAAARGRWLRLRFTLTDLLLMTAVIAVVLGVAIRAPASIRPEFRHSCFAWTGFAGFWLGWLSLLFPGMLILGGGKGRSASRRDGSRAGSRIGRIVWLSVKVLLGTVVSLVLLFCCAFMALYHLTAYQRPLPDITLPEPNGYEDLVQAGEQLPDSRQIPDPDSASRAEIEQFLTEYGHALLIARRGLARECQVPLKYTWEDTAQEFSAYDLSRAFLAEGELAERRGDGKRALNSYLDVLRLGSESVRGGLAGDALTQWILLRWGAGAIASLRGQLTVDQCRKAIEVVESIEANLEPADDVLVRHFLWTECVRGRLHRIAESSEGGSRGLVQQADLWNHVRMRLLICELAVERYRLERGSEPATLTDLAPDYLPSVPVDPCSSRPLCYHRTPSGHLLYSVGPDGVDDGGEPMERWDIATVLPGDVLLTEPKDLYLHWYGE